MVLYDWCYGYIGNYITCIQKVLYGPLVRRVYMSKLKTNKYIISNLPALIVRIMIVIPVMYVILFPLFFPVYSFLFLRLVFCFSVINFSFVVFVMLLNSFLSSRQSSFIELYSVSDKYSVLYSNSSQ